MNRVTAEAEDLLQRVRRRALGAHPIAARGVRLEQRGELRLRADRWLPFRAVQHIQAASGAFRWKARVRMAPLLGARVVDAFEGGRGRLDARLLGVLPVARARGAEVDAAELQRYLAELPWCPFAYLGCGDLAWSRPAPDVLGVAAPRLVAGAHLELQVDEHADVTEARAAARWRLEGRAQVQRAWSGRFEAHADRAGVRIPTRCSVRWHLPDGDFEYFRADVTSYTILP